MNWKDTINKIAPVLGEALLGKAGGQATRFVSEWLLGKSDATEEELNKEVDRLNEFSPQDFLKMQDQFLEEERIYAQDRASARLRQVELAKSGQRDYMLGFLTVSITLGFFTLLAILALNKNMVAENIKDLLYLMVGSLATQFATIVAFYFGSSRGSRAKDFMYRMRL